MHSMKFYAFPINNPKNTTIPQKMLLAQAMAKSYFILLFICLLTFPKVAHSQTTFTLSGSVVDSETDEPLAFANLLANKGEQGVSTDENGAFKLKLSTGKHFLEVAYIGYRAKRFYFTLSKDTTITIKLESTSTQLDEVEIRGESSLGADKVDNAEMGVMTLDPETIKLIPTIAGEPDVIKTMQLLPGVSKGVEGSTDFFVRGGDADQNLVLLDGAPIYNTGHLFGFMSVFNPDVLGDVTIVKGGFPAYYGGRLSSILDIETKEKAENKSNTSGSIGVISSRLTWQGNFLDNKLSVMLGGRRTYIDKVLETLDIPDLQLPYYFYDFNGRISFRPNPNNSFFFSSYSGTDILDFSRSSTDEPEEPAEGEEEEEGETRNFSSNFDTRGNSQSLGWKHIYSPTKLHELVFSRSSYSYLIDNVFAENTIKLNAGIEDYAGRFTIENQLDDKTLLKLGAESTIHSIRPSVLNSTGVIGELFPSSESRQLTTLESGIYAQLTKDLSENLKMNAGYRQSFAFSDGKVYTGFEPRIAFRWKKSPTKAFKASYSSMSQYMHRISSASLSLPIDIWYGVTQNIRPQRAQQISLGYIQTFPKINSFFEAEIYYKDMRNLTEFVEGTNLLFNTDFEEAIVQGKGNSYGLELLYRLEGEKLSGWVSYTLSWANREFAELNAGNPFPATYDRRHNISMVGQYKISERVSFSAVWEYISGAKFTAITGQYAVLAPNSLGLDFLNIYSTRNEVSLSDSHRLDLGFRIASRPERRFKSEWQLGIYNAYNRTTPVSLIISEADDGTFKYTQPGLFGLLPSVSYNFSF